MKNEQGRCMQVREASAVWRPEYCAVCGGAGGAIPVQLQRKCFRKTGTAETVSAVGGFSLHRGEEVRGRRRYFRER